MKTTASLMGHPVHMALAHFPVAFLIGTFAFDVAAKVLGNRELGSLAAYLLVAGVATGVLAAMVMHLTRGVLSRNRSPRR